MVKDRNEICKIISNMLDNPDASGIYHTSTAYTALELYIIRQRMEAIGWCYSYCCNLLDNGKDPRTVEVPTLISDFHEAFENLLPEEGE